MNEIELEAAAFLYLVGQGALVNLTFVEGVIAVRTIMEVGRVQVTSEGIPIGIRRFWDCCSYFTLKVLQARIPRCSLLLHDGELTPEILIPSIGFPVFDSFLGCKLQNFEHQSRKRANFINKVRCIPVIHKPIAHALGL